MIKDSLNNKLEVLRKKLLHRSFYCGMQENDILLGAFARAKLHTMTLSQLEDYDRLLSVEDPILFSWLTGKISVPKTHNKEAMQMILQFLKDI